MWFIRLYGGFLGETIKFLLALNNTSLGLFIMMITFYFYLKGNHDGALWFGGVATTLLGLHGDKNVNNTVAPNATQVNNQPTNVAGEN